MKQLASEIGIDFEEERGKYGWFLKQVKKETKIIFLFGSFIYIKTEKEKKGH